MSLLKDAEKTKQVFGNAHIIQNPMTNDWFVYVGTRAICIFRSKKDAVACAKGLSANPPNKRI